MAQLDQTQLSQIVQAVISALQVQGTAPKAAAISAPVDTLAQKDRALVAGFKRKGIPVDQIVLMDRANPAKPFNVKPFKARPTGSPQCNGSPKRGCVDGSLSRI
jgi:hypothetical protein